MLRKILIFVIVFCPLQSFAAEQPSWNEWLAEFKTEAVNDGIDPQFFDQTFTGISVDRKTLSFDRKQPEKRLTFMKYRDTRGDNYRILIGKKKYKKYAALLNQVANEYGVSACYILSLWGLESSYGHFMGKFSVIKSLATLAYDPRRSEFFRKELLYALHILQDGHITPEKFVGEWAGATGQPQFLPSSWFEYAVDYDGNGYKDIWTNHGDIFASIANYLSKNGWQTDIPWGVTAEAPANIDENLLGKDKQKTVAEWEELGVIPSSSEHTLDPNLPVSLILPYGGPYLLVTDNFKVIRTYNRSDYYAGTVGYIADEVCK